MTSILFRTDASLSIGSGHVIRSRTLARELGRRGAHVTFLCRRQEGDLIGLLESEFTVLALPELPLAAIYCCDGQPLQGRELYSAWLGCTQEQDASDCLQALHSAELLHPSWLIVDHYGIDELWETQLLSGLQVDPAPKLLVIDDLADRPHEADCLLDQNFFGSATEKRYEALVSEDCQKLLGPHYSLLGPEYAQLHPLVSKRVELRRVLVFFGGVDPENLTCRALEALMTPALADLSVDVVLGLQSPYRQLVEDLVAQRPLTTLHNPLPSLAGLIARADLAIGAGGSTTWERACLGLPSLVVAIADNQRPFAQALHQDGWIQFLGHSDQVSVHTLREALISAVQRPQHLPSGQCLTDGWGATRLATALLGFQRPMRLSPVTTADSALLLRWANAPMVRVDSCNTTPISEGDHHSWLSRVLKNPDCIYLVVNDANGCPLGQIRLDREIRSVEMKHRGALINMSLDCCISDESLGDELIQLSLYSLEQHWGANKGAFGTNRQADCTFLSSGFVFNSTRESFPSGSDCNLLALPQSRITILSDASSWLNACLPKLVQALWLRGHALRWIHNPVDLGAGDICFLLSCGRLLSPEQLALHRHNLVVHESALPRGQGWSPMTWQILEGSSQIPVTLFEATEELDAGVIYLQQMVTLQGRELVDEWRELQAQATISLCLDWIDRYGEVVAQAWPQGGESSYYRRRRSQDSILDLDCPLAEQFNLLRVVDNQRYPAYIERDGKCYEVHIQEMKMHGS